MSPIERETFLSLRKSGLGGSDAASVFNIGYGCRRRLCYDKRGVEPDFERETTLAMKLGNLFEPFLADEYAEKSHRWVSQAESRQHPLHPEARVNVDRFIFKDHKHWKDFQEHGRIHESTGVLEIKAQGRGAWSKTKRLGMPQDYILQLNHAMWVTGTEWGSFQVGNRDSGESEHWDVVADQSLLNELEREVPALWKIIQSNDPLPARLDVEDPRCSKCAWRVTCQGDSLVHVTGESDLVEVESLRPLLVEYDERKKLLDEATALMDETKEAMKLVVDETPSARVRWGKKDRKVYFRGQDGRVSWMGEEMARLYEQLRSSQMPGIGEPEALAAFAKQFPDAQTFRRQGNPFRMLRVY